MWYQRPGDGSRQGCETVWATQGLWKKRFGNGSDLEQVFGSMFPMSFSKNGKRFGSRFVSRTVGPCSWDITWYYLSGVDSIHVVKFVRTCFANWLELEHTLNRGMGNSEKHELHEVYGMIYSSISEPSIFMNRQLCIIGTFPGPGHCSRQFIWSINQCICMQIMNDFSLMICELLWTASFKAP